MAHVITDGCTEVKDQSCVAVCPVDCIVDVGPAMAIDADECIDCGACLPECPVGAIVAEQDLTAEMERYSDVGRALRHGAAAARAVLERGGV